MTSIDLSRRETRMARHSRISADPSFSRSKHSNPICSIPFFVVTAPRDLALRRAVLPELDYGVIVSGEIDMEMDGTSIHLKAGDTFVQRGTIHNWINRGTEPCVIAIVLIAAKPVEVGGKTLQAQG